jgi:hypothetical protein
LPSSSRANRQAAPRSSCVRRRSQRSPAQQPRSRPLNDGCDRPRQARAPGEWMNQQELVALRQYVPP